MRQFVRRLVGDRLLLVRRGAVDAAGGVGGRGADSSEVRDSGGVTAAVVVQHDDHALVRVAEVVQCLVRHAAGHGAVTDDSHDVAVFRRPLHLHVAVAGDGQAVRIGEDGGGVAVLDEVVAALLAVGVAADAVALAQVRKPRLATGEDLVHVGLVAGVPQDGVVRTVEDAVQGDAELDRAEVAAEVAARVADRVHDELADLGGQLVQLRRRQ